MEIDVKRNETRVEELKKIRADFLKSKEGDSTVDVIDHNILIFYIDTMSRPHLERMLPKFYQYLGKFVHNDPDVQAYQFFRYHSVRYNTYENNHAMYYGTMGDFQDDTHNVFKHFSDSGYITALIRDQCEAESINLKPGHPTPTDRMYRWDHYATGFGCDSNYDKEPGDHIDLYNGRNSFFRH